MAVVVESVDGPTSPGQDRIDVGQEAFLVIESIRFIRIELGRVYLGELVSQQVDLALS